MTARPGRKRGQAPRCAACGELGHQSVVDRYGAIKCSSTFLATQHADVTGCGDHAAAKLFGVTLSAILKRRARLANRNIG